MIAHPIRIGRGETPKRRRNFSTIRCGAASLAHVVGDKVEAAYRRGDLFEKRRRLMAEWATFCNTTKAAARVIPMRGRIA
jgi:hypothetical protein